MLVKDVSYHFIRKHHQKTTGPCPWKGPHRAEAEAHRVNDDFAVNAQRVDPLWADPVWAYSRVCFPLTATWIKQKTAPPIKQLINEFY